MPEYSSSSLLMTKLGAGDASIVAYVKDNKGLKSCFHIPIYVNPCENVDDCMHIINDTLGTERLYFRMCVCVLCVGVRESVCERERERERETVRERVGLCAVWLYV